MDENCHFEPIYKTASADQNQEANNATLTVWGMGSENCVTRVRNSLLSLDGVFAVHVYLNMTIAEVCFNCEKVSTQMLLGAVSRAGNDGRHEYRAELVTA